MILVNLQEAKAKLNQLVEAVNAGEDVVLMRGSKVVATLQPLSEQELEISSRLSDSQALRFWKELKGENSRSFKNHSKA